MPFHLTLPAEPADAKASPAGVHAKGLSVADFRAHANRVHDDWVAHDQPSRQQRDHAQRGLDIAAQLVAEGAVGELVACVVSGHAASAPGERTTLTIHLVGVHPPPPEPASQAGPQLIVEP